MTARDVVPQPAEPRGFLRRRKTDEPYPHHPVAAVAPVGPAVEPAVEPPSAVVVPALAPAVPEPPAGVEPPAVLERLPVEDVSGLDDVWLLADVPQATSCAQCEQRTEAEELFRAQASLLKAALRQADELEAALANEQHQRREQTARLLADNELLRNALAVLNADALSRQHVTEAPPPRDPFSRMVPEQRDQGSLLPPVVEQPPGAHVDRGTTRGGRRRSGREAGPAEPRRSPD